ncbi:amidase domain-containing protein [Staphylococcus warneri]|uniref:Amidase domain-containing protein n=2 Tax=Bacteria TaxID=2 RepID=A0A6H3FCS4_STAWA|nr:MULTISPECIES: amidase domain-containing protein [Staphylococcus]AGC89565.1 N-acetylmuramoyl-L-alanine amidase [Staphylococcus warneri SG1]PAK72603.1 N-acetylmuramoyl-L-alanine amidase [Staphylococcus pasteuri]EGG95852.1 N-acetylmuramoyl-L-alanine amidase [Staphylococcus warneri VCU121]KEK49931.1 mannosyl-glycoendo-beta-N-acetylglucosaminidase family protein [Staphylococcus warneri Lyso 1 2011]KKI60730.1 N-acetylmuramoyl-L-alanine amidase, family 4 [Staphylococcus warneri]
MSKEKFLTYLLTTTLIVPSFSTAPIANAADDHSTTPSSSQQRDTQNNNDSTNSDDKSTKITQEDDEINTSEHKHEKTKQSSHQNTKKEKQDKAHQQNHHGTQTSVTDDNYKQSHQSTNLINQFYDGLSTHQSDFNRLWSPDQYDDSFSLTTLIQNLFHFDSDISDYEQPSHEEDDTNTNSKNNQSDDNDKITDNDQNADNSGHSEKYPQQDETNKGDQSINRHDKENSDLSNQDNHSQSDETQDHQQSDNNQQDHSSNQSNGSNKNGKSSSNQSISDSAIDSILDEYSEDATKTQKQYQTSKDKHTQDDKQQDTKQNNTKKQDVNPQLPTPDELKHKTKPAQSFEGDFKQSNTRATGLFQQLPKIEDGALTDGDINIVDSKSTRDFIKSIAKDAHQIGQKEDLYASVMMAQAILESDSGNSALAQKPNFNLFGIKGTYQGQSVSFNTLEADSTNNMFNITAGFRKYPDTKASLEDYARLIKKGIDGNPNIYRPTWKSEASTYQSATSHLSRTYATDPNYAKKLNSIIKHYHLTDFDKKEMPSLDKYNHTIHSDDQSQSSFKPFEENQGSSSYPQGQCTWYVDQRMKQFGQYIHSNLGDAHHWNNRAAREGYQVSSTPKKHTAVVFEAGQLGADTQYGHVAFVEKVNADGSIIISESNVKGLGVISYRTIDADDASQLDYITGK